MPIAIQLFDLLKLPFKSQGFIPHGHCYLWQPGLVWLHIISNATIALAYFSIPILLVYFVSRRKDVPFHGVFLLFGLFIIACGSGHLIDIWTIWHPTYWFAAIVKAITAIISLFTALEMLPLIPKALALPSPAQLETTNQELEQTLQQLRQTQSQLIHTEKMSSVGQLVAGIAHELNNPVSFISGNLLYLRRYAQDLLNVLHLYQQAYPLSTVALQTDLDDSDVAFIQQDLPKVVESIKSGAERIAQLVLSLRNFSRLDEAEIKSVNIHEGIDSTLMILQGRLKQMIGQTPITIIKNYGDLPSIECYAGQLNQVFMNVLSNAADALEAQWLAVDPEAACLQPTITIQTRCLDGDRVQIQIADSAGSLDPDALPHIFDPFFTTKAVGKGTGLGLSISHHIVVEKHQGQLDCTTLPGQQTVFTIMLPVRRSRLTPVSQPTRQDIQCRSASQTPI